MRCQEAARGQRQELAGTDSSLSHQEADRQLLIGGVLIFLMRRGGMGCGMGGHGSHHGGQHGSHKEDARGDSQTIDPVSRASVAQDGAISSVYRGRIYRFASRENRDQFEAAPERFVTPQQADGGQPRHRGCC